MSAALGKEHQTSRYTPRVTSTQPVTYMDRSMNAESDVSVSASSVSYWHVLVRTLVQTPLFFFSCQVSLAIPRQNQCLFKVLTPVLAPERQICFPAWMWSCGISTANIGSVESEMAWTCHKVSVRNAIPLIFSVEVAILTPALRLLRSRVLRCQRTASLSCESFSAVERAALKARFRCRAIASPSADLEATFVFRPVYHGLLISEDVVFLSHSIFLWTAKGAWVTNWVLRIRTLSAVDASS